MATTASSASSTAAKVERENARSTVQDLEADIKLLREDISKLAAQMASLGGHSVNTAKRAAAEGVERLREKGEATIDDLSARAQDMEDQLTATVREKPITSLAIAAGVGYLFALLSRR